MTRFSLAGALCLLLCISMAVAFTNMKMGHTHLHPEHHLYEHFAERRVNADDVASYWDFQMGGNIYPVGIYWVAVNVGTPPQEMLVAVDSGSSDLLVPGAGCTGCHEQNTGSFNTTASHTLDPIACSNRTVKCHTPCGTQCSFVNSYQTCNLTDPQQPCTVTGPLYSDVYSQGGLTASVIFGVITSQTTNFQQFFNIDGVCGFAFAAGSSWGGTPPFDRLVQAGECNDVFAMCLKPSGGGILTLGGVDPKLFTGSWQYTPMKKYLGEYILYVLDMTDIKVNQKSIGLPASSYTQHGTMGGCVLDSGTNTILLPTPIYTPFITTFNDYFTTQCKSSSAPPGVCNNALVNGQCYQYTQAQIASFPAIQMVFNTVTLEIDGPDYIVNNGTASWYCFGVFNTGARGNLIVGDILMQNYYVQFDKKNHQVGWAPVNAANCVGDATPIIYYPSN